MWQIIEENIEAFNRKSLHELGCAGGNFVAYLKQNVVKDWEVSGEDFSETAIDSARKRAPNVNFFTNDLHIDYAPYV